MSIHLRFPAIFPLLLVILLSSCKPPAPAPEGLIRIPILEKNFLLNDTLSNYLKIEKLVRLEAHPDALMGLITRVEAVDNLIFIQKQDRSEELLVFSSEGKYLRKICNKGKGPGEAVMLDGFYVDSVYKQVYMVDWANKVIIKDYDGNLISEFKCPYGASDLVMLDKDHLVFAAGGKSEVYVTDLSGKEIHRFLYYEIPFHFGFRLPLIKTGGGALFQRYMDDTLYLVNRDTIRPRYLIDFGKNALTRKQFLQFPANEMGDRNIGPQYMMDLRLQGIAGNILAFTFSYNRKQYNAFADLVGRRTWIFEFRQTQTDPFLGKVFYMNASSNGTNFIGYYVPGSMNMDKIPQVLASAGPISMEDNPILVFYRFDFGKGGR